MEQHGRERATRRHFPETAERRRLFAGEFALVAARVRVRRGNRRRLERVAIHLLAADADESPSLEPIEDVGAQSALPQVGYRDARDVLAQHGQRGALLRTERGLWERTAERQPALRGDGRHPYGLERLGAASHHVLDLHQALGL